MSKYIISPNVRSNLGKKLFNHVVIGRVPFFFQKVKSHYITDIDKKFHEMNRLKVAGAVNPAGNAGAG